MRTERRICLIEFSNLNDNLISGQIVKIY